MDGKKMTDNLAMIPPPVLTFHSPGNPRVLSFFFDCSLQKPLYVGEIIENLKRCFGIGSIDATWFPDNVPFEGMSHLEGWGNIVVHSLYPSKVSTWTELNPLLLYSDTDGRLLEVRTWNHKQIKKFFIDVFNVILKKVSR